MPEMARTIALLIAGCGFESHGAYQYKAGQNKAGQSQDRTIRDGVEPAA